MARVTVEDCLEHVDNRFELVLTATKRARQISNGQEPLVDIGNHKTTVVALREIAEGKISVEQIEANEARANAEDDDDLEIGSEPEQAITPQPPIQE